MMIRAGTAGPSPPVGPKIGGMGLNIMNFCREFNARTENVLEGVPINTHITAYADKTYQLKIYSPVVRYIPKNIDEDERLATLSQTVDSIFTDMNSPHRLRTSSFVSLGLTEAPIKALR